LKGCLVDVGDRKGRGRGGEIAPGLSGRRSGGLESDVDDGDLVLGDSIMISLACLPDFPHLHPPMHPAKPPPFSRLPPLRRPQRLLARARFPARKRSRPLTLLNPPLRHQDDNHHRPSHSSRRSRYPSPRRRLRTCVRCCQRSCRPLPCSYPLPSHR
jgi:hypothetical protein